MAQLSLSISTAAGSTISVQPVKREGDCMALNLRTNIEALGEEHPIAREYVCIHGTISDMRLLVEAMLAALPAVEQLPEAATVAEGARA